MKKEFNSSASDVVMTVNPKDVDVDVSAQISNANDVLVPSVRGKDGTGYDIFSQVLNDTRTIVVQGQVEAGMAGVIIAQLKYLEAKDPEEPIKMLINSPGGSIIDGLAIYDVMRQVSNPITTIGVGMQASMGSVLLAGGDIRMMAPNSQLLVHQGSGGGGEGTPSDLEIGRGFHQTLVDKLTTIYQDHIGLTKEYWGVVLEHDTWFTAEQAKAIGFIHDIVATPEGKQAPYAQDRETSPVDTFAKNKEDKVAKYKTVESIVKAMNTTGATDEPETARLRPQLATKLAQFPEFWTEGKKKEVAAKAKKDNVVALKKTAPSVG